MSARTAPVSLAWSAIDVPVVIMIGAALNGFVVSVMQHLGAGGGFSLTMGVSPFQIVALLVAARLSAGAGETTRPAPIWLDALVLALILVPSSAVSSATLALYAGHRALHTTAERRIGALLFLALALASVWSSVILKWFALPVTTAEAYLLTQLLQFVRPDVVQFGNVVGNPDTHSLILMTRCTSADALPHAAVAVVAVAYLLGDVDAGRLRRALMLLVLAYVTGNLVRLGAMAWSSDSYTLVHGPFGANLFDLFQAALVLALGNWASAET